ncbi:MAG: HEPN domain-containing protein [Deltaproteobacteria bacterium]|nr:HEPN domain-containing protein [Deltaproteobacteria bacterium]
MSLAGGTSKRDFEALVDARIREARALMKAGEYDGATYLAGYSVECALKAVITKGIPAETLPPRTFQSVYTHSLEDLLGLAGLRQKLKTRG